MALEEHGKSCGVQEGASSTPESSKEEGEGRWKCYRNEEKQGLAQVTREWVGGNESRHGFETRAAPAKCCSVYDGREKSQSRWGHWVSLHLPCHGDSSRRWTQEAKGGGENEDSYFCTLGGAVNNLLQGALRSELLTRCLRIVLHGSNSSIITLGNRNPPCNGNHLSCASAFVLSGPVFTVEATRRSRKRAGW